MDICIMYYILIPLSIFRNLAECIETGNKTEDDVFPSSPPVICPPACLSDDHPCKCYSDGWIDCNGKNLTSIPVLPPCSRLINLQGNNITSIDQVDFSETIDTQIIDLSYNKITELRSGIFIQLKALKALTLHRNSIVHISDCAFYGLTALTSLDLSRNNITVIPSTAFDDNTALREITLYENKLSDLSPRWFENKTSLETVALGQNTWNCSCELRKSYDTIVNTSGIQVDCQDNTDTIFSSMCIRCSSPYYMRGFTLYNITKENLKSCDENITSSVNNIQEITSCENVIPVTRQKLMNTSEATMTTLTTTRNSISSSATESALKNATIILISESSTKRPHMKNSSMDSWVVVLIVIVVLILISFIAISIWCNDRKRRKLIRRKSYGTEETTL